MKTCVAICDGYWSHDYEEVADNDETTILECRRCGAPMIQYKE